MAGRIDRNAEGFGPRRDRGNQGQGPIPGVDGEDRDCLVEPIHHIGEFAGRINGHCCRLISRCNGVWRIRGQNSGDGVDGVLRHRVAGSYALGT